MKIAIALDIDGTLTHRADWIDPRLVEFLRGLVAQGVPIALVTGRTFSYAEKVLGYLDFPYLLAVQNGADLLEMPAKRSLERHYLDASLISEIDRAYDGQEEDFIIYAGVDRGDFCFYRPERFSLKMRPYLKKLESLGAAAWRESDFSLDQERFPLIKCFGNKEAMQALHQRLKRNPAVEVAMIHDPIDPSLYLNLITHPEANKGSVIRFFRRSLEGAVIIAAGDDDNDVKMLKEADVAIVMETAPSEMHALADIVARPAQQCGLMEAIEEAMARVC